MKHLAQQQFIANASSRLRAGRVRIAGTTGSLGEIVAGKTNNIVAGDKSPPNTLTDTTNSLSYG